jgi:hypothetical protein
MHFLETQVEKHRDIILNGRIMGIDPGSQSMGYAVAQSGKIEECGVFEMNKKAPIAERLQDIVTTLRKEGKYDLLVVEMIRGKMAHVFLKFSVGAVMGGVQAPICIEMPINAWKAAAGPDHQKSDENDAYAILHALIELAKEKS